MEFGTGVVKITPAHDPNDFEVGKRHNLPIIHMMNDDSTIMDCIGGKYAGMDRYEARKAMAAVSVAVLPLTREQAISGS